MRYYKDPNTGQVFAYESEQERQDWGAPELVEMTPGEVDEHLSPTPSLDILATRKRAEIDTARDAAFAAGLPYDIAGEPDVVQTRPQDQINLLGLSAKAQRLIAAGDTETLFTFRGLSNVNRTLTAEEMDALALAALAHIEGIYQRSWDRKDNVDAALEDVELNDDAKREAIEAIKW